MTATDFFNRELETAGRAPLQRHQDERLRELGRHLPANAFYREKFRASGCDLAAHGLAGLARLPFTTKTELNEDQRRFPPFGRLAWLPRSDYPYFHQTSGTSGRPLRWLDTAGDWESWIRCWGYVYRAAGVNGHDTAFFAFSFGPYISHWSALDGARRLGVRCIPGGGITSQQRLKAIVEHGVTVVLCTPTYALRLAEVASEHGLDLARSAVRVTIHAGEPGASVRHVRKCIEESWGAECFDHAGATELGAWGFECGVHPGGIHLNEAEFVFEVINPGTGAAADDGATGELVATNLGRIGMPAVRYRTGDLVRLEHGPCGCGRTWDLIRGGVLGRADDMLIVRGVNVYPSAIDDVVRRHAGVSEYEVEIRTVAGMDEVHLKVESAGDEVLRGIERGFREQLNIRVSLEPAPVGSLPRYESKAHRIKRVASAPTGRAL